MHDWHSLADHANGLCTDLNLLNDTITQRRMDISSRFSRISLILVGANFPPDAVRHVTLMLHNRAHPLPKRRYVSFCDPALTKHTAPEDIVIGVCGCVGEGALVTSPARMPGDSSFAYRI